MDRSNIQRITDAYGKYNNCEGFSCGAEVDGADTTPDGVVGDAKTIHKAVEDAQKAYPRLKITHPFTVQHMRAHAAQYAEEDFWRLTNTVFEAARQYPIAAHAMQMLKIVALATGHSLKSLVLLCGGSELLHCNFVKPETGEACNHTSAPGCMTCCKHTLKDEARAKPGVQEPTHDYFANVCDFIMSQYAAPAE